MGRHTRGRRGRRVAAALLAVGLAAAPFAAPAQAQEGSGRTLRVAVTSGIDHMNPFTASFAASTSIGRVNWEFLTAPSQDNQKPSPGLAERWEPSPDKLSWTFHIRRGAQWSDGQPLTARDAAFTLNFMQQNPGAQEANGSQIENIASAASPDDGTLVIRLKAPQSSIAALDVPIVPQHVWQRFGDMKDPRTDTPEALGVGSGPFTISEYVPKQYVKLRANDRYWRGKPKFDELQFVEYDNADAAVQALKNGEVDMVNRLTPTQFGSLQDAPNVKTNNAPGRRYTDLLINPGAATADNRPLGNGSPALKDVRVRRAIAAAIDPKVLVEKVYGGLAQPPGGLIPPVFGDYHWSPGPAEAYRFDAARANAELDAAGYRKGPDGMRTGPDGKPLQLRLLGRSNEDAHQRIAEYLVPWLRGIGIGVAKDLVGTNEVDERTTNGDYDLALSGWAVNADPDSIIGLDTCAQRPSDAGSSGSSPSFFCDAEFERLNAQQRSETDPAQRADTVRRAQARYYDQAPSVVLYYQNSLEAYRSDKIASVDTQPKSGGPILESGAYWGVFTAAPGSSGSGGGPGPVLWIVIAVVVVAGIGGAGYAFGKRGKDVEDRE